LTVENAQLLAVANRSGAVARENKNMRKQMEDFSRRHAAHFAQMKAAMEELRRRQEAGGGSSGAGIRPANETLAVHVKDLERGFRKVSKKLKQESARARAQDRKLKHYKQLVMQLQRSDGGRTVPHWSSRGDDEDGRPPHARSSGSSARPPATAHRGGRRRSFDGDRQVRPSVDPGAASMDLPFAARGKGAT
jgi:hypothetical protein